MEGVPMPTFEAGATCEAALEDVWKFLYDPSRFPEWWIGVESVENDRDAGYTMYPTGYPDFPMPQTLHTDHARGRVEISCLVSDLVFDWRLRPAGDDAGSTEISVHVEIPESEAGRLAAQIEIIRGSLARLVALAAR
jgi:uncharacterized protein YndB with AHSA1/START domain